MTELLRIQKIFRRMKVFFAIAAAICFALSVLAAAAAVIRGIEGEAYIAESGFLSRLAEALDFGGGGATLGLFIMDAISFFALGVLLVASALCLSAERKDGTPFSENGARRVRVLGMLFFFVSLATEMAAVIMRESFSVAQAESIGVVGGMATGIALMMISPVIRYGTVLQDMLMLRDVPPPEEHETAEEPLSEDASGSGFVERILAETASESAEKNEEPQMKSESAEEIEKAETE